MKTWLFFIVFLLGCLFNSHAQYELDNYERIGTKQGLSHNIVGSVLCDSEGYLWIGTFYGLSVYDGNKYNNYKNIFDTIKSSNWAEGIDAIFEDSKHNIWLGSKAGLISCFNRQKRSFKTYSNANSPSSITCFYEDSNGTIWFGCLNGEIGYVTQNRLVIVEKIRGKVLCITAIDLKKLIFISIFGIYDYNKQAALLQSITFQGWKYHEIICIQPLPGSTKAIVVTSTGSKIIDLRQRNIIKTIRVPNNASPYQFHKVGITKKGNWLYTNADTIDEYNSDGIKLNSLFISENVWYNNEKITGIIEDNSGIIWLSSNTGLYKIDRRKYVFHKYTANSYPKKIGANYIRSLSYDNKQHVLWIGYRQNLLNELRYDTLKKTFQAYKAYKMRDRHNRLIKDYIVNKIITLRNGRLLMGNGNGVFTLDKTINLVVPFMPQQIPDTVSEVWSLLEDKNGNIWIGTRGNGLYVLEMKSKKLYNYVLKKEDTKSISDNSVWNIFEDSYGTIWLGTDNYLDKVINPKNISALLFQHYTFSKKEKLHVWNIVEDDNKNLFIGTTGNGIFQLSKNRETMVVHDVLPTNVISGILPDKNNFLWVTTVNGLFHYNTQNKTFKPYDEHDGLINNEFNFNAITITSSGEIFAGSQTGIISFTPSNIVNKDYSNAPIKITSLRIAGADSACAISNKHEVILNRKQNYISIGFCVLEFTKPIKHAFRYKLQGFDEKWNYANADQPLATYTNLPPGKYTFIVSGTADGNQWSNNIAKLKLYIVPAWWQRTMPQVGMFLTILCTISWLVVKRTKDTIEKERRKHAIEKQIAALELRALQAQMNPHFIFNAMNAIQQFILNNSIHEANKYLTRFASLMRLFLESSKNRYINMAAELELIELYISLEKLRFDDKFEYCLSVDKDIVPEKISIPSMLIQPFVENAINHGLMHKIQKGKLDVQFSIIGKSHLNCVIDDDGIGIEKSSLISAQRNKKHISRGMQIIEERVKTYNFIDEQDIKISIIDKQPPQSGTRVEIIIPIRFI